MAIKPSPTIAGKLRKLFNNNKQTIEPAIGDSIPGGGGGALVVHFTYDDVNYTYNADKTCKEILDAIRKGTSIIGVIVDTVDEIETYFTVGVFYTVARLYLSSSDKPWGGSQQIFCAYSDDNTTWSIPDY